jgi:ubiquitin-like protein Nedd8
MKINVQTLTGTKHTFNVEPEEKIQLLKQKMNEKTGIDEKQQRLVFDGKILSDDKTIGETLKAGQTIQMILQLK